MRLRLFFLFTLATALVTGAEGEFSALINSFYLQLMFTRPNQYQDTKTPHYIGGKSAFQRLSPVEITKWGLKLQMGAISKQPLAFLALYWGDSVDWFRAVASSWDR